MTPHPRQKDKYYLISEREIDKIYRILKKHSFYEEIINELLDPCCSRPYTPAKSEQEIFEEVKNNIYYTQIGNKILIHFGKPTGDNILFKTDLDDFENDIRKHEREKVLDEIEAVVIEYRENADYWGDITDAEEVLKKIKELRKQGEQR